jgi:hypothetical protein
VAVPLAFSGPIRRDGASHYDLALAVTPLHVEQVTLETETPFFDRGFRLLATLPDGSERTLARGTLARRAGASAEMVVGFAPARVQTLELVVDDGDDAPLAFIAARASVLLPEVFLAAPAGAYSLLVGNPDAAPPSYELARARELVLAVASAPATVGPLGENPDYSFRARFTGGGGAARTMPRVLLWTALGVAVLVLTALTLRLARREEASGRKG